MNEGKTGEGKASDAEELDAGERAAMLQVLYRLEIGPMSAELTGDGIWRSKFDGLASLLNTAYSPERFNDVRWDALEKAAEVASEKLDAKLVVVSQREEGESFGIGADGKPFDVTY